MPIPRAVARLNRAGLNRAMRPVATFLPGFGVVVHRGRRSGRVYRTPVNVFQVRDSYVIALTYGPQSDWVKNVLAAGEAELIIRRRSIHVHRPHIYHDSRGRAIGPIARPILRLLRVNEFLALRPG